MDSAFQDPQLLTAQLERVASTLADDPPADNAKLAALLPCEPAIGAAAVVVWQVAADDGGGQPRSIYELVALVDGERIDDPHGMREALVLLAMTEALEQLLAPLQLRELVDLLIDWQQSARDASSPDQPEPEHVTTTAWAAVEILQRLEFEVGDADLAPRMARPQRLDQLGDALRALEAAWGEFERAADQWMHAAHADNVGLAEQLWKARAAARRGPLSMPVSSTIAQGRAAGIALADEVIDAS